MKRCNKCGSLKALGNFYRDRGARDGYRPDCALCECPPTLGISLHVDHDHGTGEIRGLLCVRCNNALGLFREDPDLLRRAASYVTADAKHRSQRTSLERRARERALALRGLAA